MWCKNFLVYVVFIFLHILCSNPGFVSGVYNNIYDVESSFSKSSFRFSDKLCEEHLTKYAQALISPKPKQWALQSK